MKYLHAPKCTLLKYWLCVCLLISTVHCTLPWYLLHTYFIHSSLSILLFLYFCRLLTMKAKSHTLSKLRLPTHSWIPVSSTWDRSRTQRQSRWTSWTQRSLPSSQHPPTPWMCMRTLLQELSLAQWRLTTWMPAAVRSGNKIFIVVCGSNVNSSTLCL